MCTPAVCLFACGSFALWVCPTSIAQTYKDQIPMNPNHGPAPDGSGRTVINASVDSTFGGNTRLLRPLSSNIRRTLSSSVLGNPDRRTHPLRMSTSRDDAA